MFEAAPLGDRRPRAGTDRPHRYGVGARSPIGEFARRRIWPRSAGGREVEDDGRRHDGDAETATRDVATAVRFEAAHDPVGGREAKRAAPGEHERLDRLDLHAGSEKPELSCSGCGTADFGCGHVRLGEEHHGDTGVGGVVGVVTDGDAGDGGERRVGGHDAPV